VPSGGDPPRCYGVSAGGLFRVTAKISIDDDRQCNVFSMVRKAFSIDGERSLRAGDNIGRSIDGKGRSPPLNNLGV